MAEGESAGTKTGRSPGNLPPDTRREAGRSRGVARAAIGLGAVVLVGAGLVGASALGRLFVGESVALHLVERGRFVREVTAEGLLEAVDVTPIIVPPDVDGPQKIAWLAEDGTVVNAGDPVVEFDAYTATRKLEDGRADRTTAVRKIEKTRAEGESDVKGLEMDSDLAVSELKRAESFAPRDDRIFSRNEIIESGIDRDLLQKRATAARTKAEAGAQRTETEIALNEIERRKAEIRIRQAERGLSSLSVTAPHGGIFSQARNWRGTSFTLGDTVWPGQNLGEIPDLSRLQAKVYVLEADAGGLEPGATATVRIKGRPGAEFKATVTRVDAMAKTVGRGNPTRFFETILSFESTEDAGMKAGQTVEARIHLEELEDVLPVPRQAVFEKNGERIVYRMEGGTLRPAVVEVGSHSLSSVVIMSGLEPGDRIALRDPTRSASDIFSGTAAGQGQTKGSE